MRFEVIQNGIKKIDQCLRDVLSINRYYNAELTGHHETGIDLAGQGGKTGHEKWTK
jgi:hypothetical protein